MACPPQRLLPRPFLLARALGFSSEGSGAVLVALAGADGEGLGFGLEPGRVGAFAGLFALAFGGLGAGGLEEVGLGGGHVERLSLGLGVRRRVHRDGMECKFGGGWS